MLLKSVTYKKLLFERLLYSMIQFFTENSLILHNQSDLKLVDSSANQLLSTTDQINLSDDGQEVQSVFLDISKAFDKVCRKGFVFKLKQNSTSGNL